MTTTLTEPLRILLISTDSAYLKLIKHILHKGNSSVESVDTAEAAVRRLAGGDIQVLMMDVSTVADLEAFSMLRRRMPSVPAVILTDDDALALETLKRGAQDSLVKGQADEKVLTRVMHFSIERKRAENEELKSTKLQLIQAEKMESVGRLAAGVAHEVKNPLATIKMGVDYLEKRSNGDQNSRIILHEIDEAVRRANTVIRGLLDFSVTKELNVKVMNLGSIVDLSLILVRHDLDQKHIRVTTEIPADLPPVELDINKTEQVLINVFTNAAYAMGAEGEIAIRAQAKHENSGLWVDVQIDDTGGGIPEESLAKLFDPFYTTKPAGDGSGLGLTVCQKIMELHGGTITIANRPDKKGARVTLRFRAAKANAEA